VGDYENPSTFQELAEYLKDFKLPVIYLAIAPAYFAQITEQLAAVGLTKRARVVVEKPFGRDLESAKQLDSELKKLLPEEQIYRIDHYLGKESVEDLLVFRFANTLFEPVWNRNYIQSIQITMAEQFGIDGRGKFYDEVGATRDVLQNHILQVLTMLTMEPPISMNSEDLQNEKIKVLSAIRDIKKSDVVRGQFVGFLEEEGVAQDSNTETFVAMKVFIDNWRWAGVPIYMRTGKKMPETVLEVIVEFKQPPRSLFGKSEANIVRFRLGAHDGVDISLQAKKPGTKLVTDTVDLSVEFVAEFGDRQGPYERLLRAAMLGDHFRFTRIDSVLHSWAILDDLLKNPSKALAYEPGTWGPQEAQEMISGGWSPVGAAADEIKDSHH
jgi:glucose-6-phosphate 1-dehydrogenase